MSSNFWSFSFGRLNGVHSTQLAFASTPETISEHAAGLRFVYSSKIALGIVLSIFFSLSQSVSASAVEKGDKVIAKNGAPVYLTKEGELPVDIRRAEQRDFAAILKLNREAFPHDNGTDDDARAWIEAHQKDGAADFARYYVITYKQADGQESPLIGYALWSLDGGYNHHSTVRQDQIAVQDDYRSHKFGEALARLSLLKFQEELLTPKGYEIHHIYITSGSDNAAALEMYDKSLGLKNLGNVGPVFGENQYGKDEFILINNDVQGFLKANPIEELLAP